MNKAPFTLEQINAFTREEFVRVIGPVFERSPWIAEVTWARRPFASVDALHRALRETVAQADEKRQIALISAHPDLAGRAALAGTLTVESASEQARAGLDCLSDDEIARFKQLNQAYRDQFGFPFVICARLNKKAAILAALPDRLKHTRDEELSAALAEIYDIARLRLEDLIPPV